MKKRLLKILKKAFMYGIILLGIVFLCILFADKKIKHDTKAFIFDKAEDVPPQQVALVLGASKNLRNGNPNPYFSYRIQAAKELYEAGKVKTFVVSGDNGRHTYNEPQDMYDALVEKGIPDSIIHMDYAGFRTLDSVVRMKEIFGQESYISVSQQFHNERAIFIAQHYNLLVYGYNATDVEKYRGTKTREKLARVKVFIDMLINKQPKFLGESIDIS